MTLRILHLEDDPTDQALVTETLRADGIAVDVIAVHTRDHFEAALDTAQVDIILADYQLPAFDGLTAQTIAKAKAPEVPFIFVSGTLGEEIAIERLKDGAVDYVLKQRLARLPSSVRRAMAETATRSERARAERALRELNGELERRVAARTADLAAALEVLASRERQLRESEGRLQAILAHSPAIIYVKDCDGRYLLVNRQFETLVSRRATEVIGMTDIDLFGPRLGAVYHAHDLEALAAAAPCDFEEPVVREDGLRICVSSKFPLRDADGLIYAICGISVDITERRHAEEAAKLAQLEAERANRTKSAFLSNMSHELRTPLNSILGFAQVLASDDLGAEPLESVQHILRGGHHLLGLINEVLDIARIESGHLSLSSEPVAVDDILRHVLTLLQPLAEQHGVTTTVEHPPGQYVVADRQRFTQILLNLVSNAMKYNRPQGSVFVTTERPADGRLRIRVTDTGFGISRQKRDLLFEPFERLGAEQTTIEGTGLGLAVSKRLAEAMGGVMGLETEVDVGSTFWVDLPMAEAPVALVTAADDRRAAIADNDRVHGTVLYIEDNTANVVLLKKVLRRRPGVRLVSANTGRAGIDCAHDQPPGLILLDLHLPDMHGDDVLRLLWEHPVTRAVPVVILSADATLHQERRMMAGGAVAYLTKPFDIAHVLETVDLYLAQCD